MGGWGVFLGLRIFFLKIFHPKIKSVQNGLKCKKNIKKFSLLNNYSLRPGWKAMARAGSIWIISGIFETRQVQKTQVAVEQKR